MIIDWQKGALDQYTFSAGRSLVWNWSATRVVSSVVLGPYCVVAGEVFVAGVARNNLGEILGEVFVAGAVAGEGGCD